MDVDVVIVGAGLSGIGAAVHLQTECPNKTYVVLEGREALGGTWDLFRYPGIRSDSDMYTLGYKFRPWTDPKAIADGPSILAYIRATADDNGITPHIRFRHKVERASWSNGHWQVEARTAAGELVQITCRFLFACSGYYDYAKGYTPELAGIDRFKGRVVHPQHWPADLRYANQQVVVIGSGATAVTLVPELAKTAAHVTMLQRSPTYILSRPSVDTIADWLRAHLPAKPAYALSRWKNILLNMGFYAFSRRFPEAAKKLVVKGVRNEVGETIDVEKHFSPSYKPWDQRVCLVPDGDLFTAVRNGSASVVTDTIDTFTQTGIRLRSGVEIAADLVVTATGLNVQFLGGAELRVDAQTVVASDTMAYKGLMISDVPNFAFAVGYTNASWTLKCDLASEYVCRLLNFMDAHGYTSCVPRRSDPTAPTFPLIDFTSGYVQRALSMLPKQGAALPWRVHQNYIRDLALFRHQPVDDEMEFS